MTYTANNDPAFHPARSNNGLTPTFHRPFNIGEKVILDHKGLGWMDHDGEPICGTIIGIASVHIAFHYIVLLPKPLKEYRANLPDDIKDSTGVSILGSLLKLDE